MKTSTERKSYLLTKIILSVYKDYKRLKLAKENNQPIDYDYEKSIDRKVTLILRAMHLGVQGEVLDALYNSDIGLDKALQLLADVDERSHKKLITNSKKKSRG